jgi:hypothetical protein
MEQRLKVKRLVVQQPFRFRLKVTDHAAEAGGV